MGRPALVDGFHCLPGSGRLFSLSDSPFHTISGLCPRGVVFCVLSSCLPLGNLRYCCLPLGMSLPSYPLLSLRRLGLSVLALAVDMKFV